MITINAPLAKVWQQNYQKLTSLYTETHWKENRVHISSTKIHSQGIVSQKDQEVKSYHTIYKNCI